MAKEITYYYGMRLRGFSPGAQPVDGLVGAFDTIGGYHSVVIYKRMLTEDEVREYELDYLGTEKEFKERKA